MPIETIIAIVGGIGATLQVGMLTAIWFRLGRGQAKMEELFRRVIELEKLSADQMKGVRNVYI